MDAMVLGIGRQPVILGFTGTRNKPTQQQWHQTNLFLFDNNINEAHHGACDGSDLMFHRCAINFATPIIVHPPIKEIYLARECLFMPTPEMIESDYPEWAEYDVTVLPAKGYLERDRDIVDACDHLLATPEGPRKPHSGTWYTIDYALTHSKPVTVIWPDGKIEKL